MRRLELKRITAALRQLTPDQRKNVAVELAALDAQPASTAFAVWPRNGMDAHFLKRHLSAKVVTLLPLK